MTDGGEHHPDRDIEARFDATFRAHYPAVVSYLRKRLPADDVADVAAEVFAVAWRRAAEFDGKPPLPWLYGVAYNKCSERYKGRRRQRELGDRLRAERQETAPNVADLAERHELSSKVFEAVQKLPAKEREVIRLAAIERLSYAEIGETLGLTEAAVRSKLHRARNRLRSLAEWGDRP